MDRVAMKKGDFVTIRNAQIKSKGYQVKDKEKKQASKEDLDKLDAKMNKSTFKLGTHASRDGMDIARSLNAATAAAAAAGSGGSAFGDCGQLAGAIPDITDLLSEPETEKEEEADTRGDAAGTDERDSHSLKRKGTGGSGQAGGDPPSAKKQRQEEWFDKDKFVGGAIKAHQIWYDSTKTLSRTSSLWHPKRWRKFPQT